MRNWNVSNASSNAFADAAGSERLHNILYFIGKMPSSLPPPNVGKNADDSFGAFAIIRDESEDCVKSRQLARNRLFPNFTIPNKMILKLI